MDALTIMTRCRNAAADMEELEGRIRQRRDALESAGGAPGVSASRQGMVRDRMAEAVSAITELEKRLAARRERYAVEIVAASAISESLDQPGGRVAYLYYGKGLNARAIARRMQYSEGYVRQLKRRAEDQLRGISGAQLYDYLPAWYLEG